MIPTHSSWLAAHGKLWYDDKWYRLAWLISPQALIAVLVLLFWAASPSEKSLPWAKPVDPALRDKQLAALRDSAKTDRQAMDKLEREARGGDMAAQFYFGTLFDPSIHFSTIVQPDVTQAADWYARAAAQGNDSAEGNLALFYSDGRFVRLDYTRACFYARKLGANSYAPALRVKGDCYARGLGGMPVDLAQAAEAYEVAASKGNTLVARLFLRDRRRRQAARFCHRSEALPCRSGQRRLARAAQSRLCLQFRLARPATRRRRGCTPDPAGTGKQI